MCSETFAGLAAAPAPAGDFSANISRVQIGQYGLTWARSSPVRVDFLGSQVGKWSDADGGCFLLTLQYAGICSGSYHGRTFALHPGDIFIADISSPVPWHFTSETNFRAMTIKIPANRLLGLANFGDLRGGVVIPSSNAHSRVAFSLFTAIRSILDDELDDAWHQAQEDVISSILNSLLSATGDPFRSPSQPHRQIACTYIEQHLANPDLTVTEIASHVGTSVRTLQRTFFDAGMTVQRYMLSRRIVAAANRLREPYGRLSVTEVAMAVGFNDLGHFSRTFRKATGRSPRQYRSTMLI